MFPIRSGFGIRLFAEVVLRQETVQLGKARIVFGQGHIEQFVAVAKLYAHDRPYALSLAFHHKVGGTHRRVDVGQRQDSISERGGFIDQVRYRYGAVAQAVI